MRAGKAFLKNPDLRAAVLANAWHAIQTTQRAVELGAKAVTSETLRTQQSTPALSEAQYNKTAAHINSLASNPQTMMHALQGMHPLLAKEAPKTFAAMQIHEARAVQFLASKVAPTQFRDVLGNTHAVSASERALFARSLRAVQNPVGVLKDVANGTVTREGVEALEAVHPDLLRQMRGEVMQAIAKSGKLPSYKIRSGVELFLGQDLTHHSDQFFSRNQAAYAPMQPAANGNSPEKSSREVSGMSKLTIAQRSAPKAPGRSVDIE
jgi:hypothetical protein